VLEAPGPAVAQWVMSDGFLAAMASLFPAATAPPSADTAQLLSRERAARAQCEDAFAAVARFEGSHSLQLASMGAPYLNQVRPGAEGAGNTHFAWDGARRRLVRPLARPLARPPALIPRVRPPPQPPSAPAAHRARVDDAGGRHRPGPEG
jgi:hypothetical protein